MSHVAFYITGHGFGHATRMGAVATALAARVPDLRLTVISTIPRWLVDLNFPAGTTLRSRALDVGVVQHDSIRLDRAATLQAYGRLLEALPGLIRNEADRLHRDAVDLVVADIPPAAFPIARAAGVAGVGITNFTWDWIYADYVRAHPAFADLVERIREAYAEGDCLLRLPLHGPCDAFRRIRDIPLIARPARRSRAEARAILGLDASRPIVLLSFGGFEIQGIDLERVERLDDYLFLTTQPPARPLRNVRLVHLANGLRYPDLVAQADAVITKPGYGIVSECLVNRTRMLYTSRGEFAEYGALVEGLERFAVSAFLSNDDLLAGNWRGPLESLLRRPAVWPDIPANGAEIAAGLLQTVLLGGALPDQAEEARRPPPGQASDPTRAPAGSLLCGGA
jgi:L-arabinokinase